MRAIDYFAHHNRLAGWHPVEKALFAFSHLFLVLFLKEMIVSIFVFLLMGMAAVLGARVPWRCYVHLLSLPLVFLLMSILPLLVSIAPSGTDTDAFIQSHDVLGWHAYISSSALKQAVVLCLSAYAAVSCMYFFILTTPFQGIALVLYTLRVPQVFVDLTAVTYRFIFVLIVKAEETYKAQKSRAGYSGWRSSLHSLSSLTANLFVQTMREARAVQMAVDARGGADVKRKGASEYTLRPYACGLVLVLFFLSCSIGLFF
ncbi:cobalt ECF transporter T component CbiQ [Pseudobacillus wudalianchiensis]|uniref:Cobalt ECF transporter T component CbiQ n=1 Tax=Pseudobacillus wudalianchiensis TaxID=1743143 RepID=A0A1B9AN13_9BACI|nr:cobalt ECF transporter T component CbiQ [Bacillus wudalianchiensis]OCA85185.1 cobalt ECF transporter T component CbiQ [Bacillus wudalianchiensis]